MKKIILIYITFIGLAVNAQTDSIRVHSYEYQKIYGDSLWQSTRIKPVKSINEFVDKLNSNDVNVKSVTLEYLGKVDDPSIIPAIENLLLHDSSEQIRAQSAKTLLLVRAKESIPTLKEALQDTSKEVRLQAAASLAYLGEKTECIKIFKEEWATGDMREKMICNMGYLKITNAEAVNELKKSTGDTNPYVSVDAAIMLAQLGYYDDAMPVLKGLSSHSDKYIRAAVIRGYSYIYSDEVLELLREKLHDKELFVRNSCIGVLRRYHKKVPVYK